MDRGYQILEHTADMAVRFWAPDFSGLLEQAAEGVGALVSSGKVRPVDKRRLLIESDNREELFLRWLREVLFLFESGMIFAKVKITEWEDEREKGGAMRVRAVIDCEKIDPARHDICMEIKAITRHGLRINRSGSGWEAQVLFDI